MHMKKKGQKIGSKTPQETRGEACASKLEGTNIRILHFDRFRPRAPSGTGGSPAVTASGAVQWPVLGLPAASGGPVVPEAAQAASVTSQYL